MSDEFRVRLATPSDAPVLARHRTEMFHDMGTLPADQYDPFRAAAERDLAAWLESGEYVSWVVSPLEVPNEIVGGAGVQVRKLLPRPVPGSPAIRVGPEAIVFLA